VNLTASAGIACNKMLAKICTDVNKPNGQFYLPPDKTAVTEFINSLDVRKVPYIGVKTENLLNKIGVLS
jgi:DNA polymerase kappa